jgi:hypothetical protein
MKPINYARVLVGGLAAGLLLFLADGLIHEMLLKEHWMAALEAAGRRVETEQHGGGMAYFALFELLRGLALAWVYAVFRTHFGPGPKTAVCSALTVWGILFPIAFTQEIPLGFRSPTMLSLWALYEVVPSVIAGLVAGALYKDRPGV